MPKTGRAKTYDSPSRRGGYLCEFSIPPEWWSGTDTIQTERKRAERRHYVRSYAREQWRALKRSRGAYKVDRFVALIGVSYPHSTDIFPARAAETVKPIIDAGTDVGLWPDDDASHRCSTIYFRLPYVSPSRSYLLQVLILPVPGLRPTYQVTGALGREVTREWAGSSEDSPDWPDGYQLRFTVSNRLWLSSNLSDSDIKARQSGAHKASRWGSGNAFGIREKIKDELIRDICRQWERQSSRFCGYERFIVLAGIGYAANVGRSDADPDNCAETVNAIMTAGTRMRAWHGTSGSYCKAVAFFRLPAPCLGGTHDVRLLVLPVPRTFQITSAVADSAEASWSDYDDWRQR